MNGPIPADTSLDWLTIAIISTQVTEEVKGKLTQERCYLVTETERLEQTRHGKMSSDVTRCHD